MMHKVNHKGSTLIMVILVLSVLSMLGITLLSITAVNFKMKILNSKANRNFYFAESGLDEAYGLLGKLIEEGITEGNNKVKEFLNSQEFEDLRKEFFESYQVYENLEEHKDLYKRFEEEVVQPKKKDEFEKIYKNYIKSKLTKNFFSEYIPVIEQNNRILKLELINTPKFVLENKESKKEFLIVDVKSTYKKDKIERIIQASFIILTPEYGNNNADYIMEEINQVPINIIWNQGITTDGNLNVKESNLQIYGDIYIGENQEKAEIPEDFAEGNKTDVVVYGDVYAKNLLIDSQTANTKINIENKTDEQADEYESIIQKNIDFEAIKNTLINTEREFILLNKNDQDFAIVGKNADESKISSQTEKIHLNNTTNGLIIISGTLYVCGEVNFTGTIITKNGINMVPNNSCKTNIEIKHDPNIVAKFIHNYYDIFFKEVFKNNSDNKWIPIKYESKMYEEIVPFGHLQDNYIRLKSWKRIR